MLKRAILIASAVVAGAAPSWAQTRIAVGTPPIAEVEAAFVAKDEGMFEKNGLNVEFLPTGSNQTLVAALVAGSHQIVAVSPTVLLQAVDSGIDLVVVANCGVTAPRTATNVGLAVRGGVEISKPEDIKGKKVGTPSIGGTLDILFRQWLKQKNVPEKSITFIEVPIPNTADVLKGGTIDAIIAGEPSLGRAVSQSNGKVAFNYMSEIPENLPYTTFVATREWAKANAGTIQVLPHRLCRGGRLCGGQPGQNPRNRLQIYPPAGGGPDQDRTAGMQDRTEQGRPRLFRQGHARRRHADRQDRYRRADRALSRKGRGAR